MRALVVGLVAVGGALLVSRRSESFGSLGTKMSRSRYEESWAEEMSPREPWTVAKRLAPSDAYQYRERMGYKGHRALMLKKYDWESGAPHLKKGKR